MYKFLSVCFHLSCIILFLLGIYLELKSLGYMVTLCLTGKLPNYFPKRLNYFTFSPTIHESSNFSMLSQILFYVFDYNNYGGRWNVLHCGLICISVIANLKNIFMCLLASCKIVLQKCHLYLLIFN